MTDLMRTILDDVHSDGPRLVYADAIEESDPNRAEYIRCQIHGGPEWLMIRLAENAEWSKKPEGIDHIVWRRGFPDSVTLPLARLVGVTCERCRSPYRTRFFMGRPGTEIELPLMCDNCVESLAPVLAGWPLSEIRLSDKEPWEGIQWPMAIASSARWYFSDNSSGFHRESDLPKELFSRLQGGIVAKDDVIIGGLILKYHSRESAVAALSAACLAFVRDAVELRPLPARIMTTREETT